MRLRSARITTGNGSKLMSAPSQETRLEHELPSHPLQLVGCILWNAIAAKNRLLLRQPFLLHAHRFTTIAPIAPNRTDPIPLTSTARRKSPSDSSIACSGPHIAQLSNYRFRWRPPNVYLRTDSTKSIACARIDFQNHKRGACSDLPDAPIAAILCATSLCVINTS